MVLNWTEITAVVGVFAAIIAVIQKMVPRRNGYVQESLCKVIHSSLDQRLGSIERKLDLIIEQKAGL